MGRGKVSLSKKIKNSVKGAVKFINNFESTVCDIAAENEYKYVICGHIHHPEIKTVITEKGPVVYMNSGDWIENLTSLEYNEGEWKIYRYADDAVAQAIDIDKKKQKETPKQLMANLMMEMNLKQNGTNGDISNSIEAA
jgi:predicted phosphodiesterase